MLDLAFPARDDVPCDDFFLVRTWSARLRCYEEANSVVGVSQSRSWPESHVNSIDPGIHPTSKPARDAHTRKVAHSPVFAGSNRSIRGTTQSDQTTRFESGIYTRPFCTSGTNTPGSLQPFDDVVVGIGEHMSNSHELFETFSAFRAQTMSCRPPSIQCWLLDVQRRPFVSELVNNSRRHTC